MTDLPNADNGCAPTLLLMAAVPLLIAGLLFSQVATCSGEGEECFGVGLFYVFFGLPMLVIGLALICGAAMISAKPRTLLQIAVPCLALAGWLYVRALRCDGGGEQCEEAGAYLAFALPIQVAGLALICSAAIRSAKPGDDRLAAAAVTIGASLILTIVLLVALG